MNAATKTWIAWVDGKKDEAIEFEVPICETFFDVADAGAKALGIEVCEELNVEKV